MGRSARVAEGTTARGIWRWPAAGSDSTALPGDWYLRAGDASPVAGAFLGQPVDSFPPAIQLTPLQPGPGDWVALTAQLGRRGAPRPAVFGRRGRAGAPGDRGGGRALALGLPRRLAASRATAPGSPPRRAGCWAAPTRREAVARPVRPVVQNGRPLVFEWIGAGAAGRRSAVAWSGDGSAAAADTLRFDGSGRATVWLPPGEYRYRLAGGGGGTVAVEEYSDELLPRPVTLGPHDGAAPAPPSRTRGPRLALALRALRRWRSPASGSRDGGWGCARTGVRFGHGQRQTDGQERGPLDPHQARRA